jgi:hypothetical protein
VSEAEDGLVSRKLPSIYRDQLVAINAWQSLCSPSFYGCMDPVRSPQKCAEYVVLVNFLYLIKIHLHPAIHPSYILRSLFEYPPSSHLLTSHKNLQTSRSTERSARTDQGDNRLRSGEKKSVRGGRNPALIQKPSQLDRSTTKYLQDIIDTV